MTKNREEKLKDLLNNFGILRKLEEKKLEAYSFSCDTAKIFDKNTILHYIGKILFLLIVNGNSVSIYCFRVWTNKGIEKEILEIINDINKSTKYGKFIVDSDGDVNWEYIFDLEHISKKEIGSILCSFFESVLKLSSLINNVIIRNKKTKNNE